MLSALPNLLPFRLAPDAAEPRTVHYSAVETMAKTRTYAKKKPAPAPPAAVAPVVTPAAPIPSGQSEELVRNVERDLPGAFVIAVINTAEQVCVASHLSSPAIDLPKLVQFCCQMVQQRLQAAPAAKAGEPRPHELLVTTTTQLHLIKRLDNQENVFIFLAVPTQNISLALVREILHTHLSLVS